MCLIRAGAKLCRNWVWHPWYIYMKCLMKGDVWPEDALGLVSVQAQHFLGQARLNPRQLLVRITVLLHRHHFLQRRAEHGGPKDGVTSVSDLLDRGLVQTLQTHRAENNSELKSSPCMLGLLSLQTSSYTLSISKWDFSRYICICMLLCCQMFSSYQSMNKEPQCAAILLKLQS